MIAAAATLYPWLIWPAVLVVFVAMDAFYCGMETGIYVLNKVRLDLHAEAGRAPARYLQRLLRNYNNLLGVLLLGTNITRYIATFSISAMFVMAGHGEGAEWYTLAVATPAFFVFTDAVPKQVFQRLDEGIVYALAPLLRVSEILFKVTGLNPLVRGVSALLLRITGAHRGAKRPLEHAGVHAAVAEGQASGLISQFQSIMAERVVRIADVKLADVMKPLSEALTAPRDVARDEFIRRVRDHDYARVPLLDETGAVAGIVNVYDVLAGPDSALPRDSSRPPHVLPAGMTVTDALYQMQRAHAVLTVVGGTGGRHLGIVTLKDLVEEIVGELDAW